MHFFYIFMAELKKRVVLDLRNLDNPTSGFGQIASNYARLFSSYDLPDLKFVFLLPEKGEFAFGDKVECVRFSKAMRKNNDLLPKGDLWHSLNQQQKYRRIDDDTKFLLTIHDLNYLREKNWLRQLKHNWVLGRLVRRADKVTAISQFVADEVSRVLLRKNGDEKKLEVVYDAVEDISGKEQSKPAFASGRPFFFSIGQIRLKKNFHRLPEMMKQFPDHDLYICGDDHFEAAKIIRNEIRRNHLTNVFLTGKISDSERIWLYSHCDALLFPSQGEGFGLPVIEAMQFGKPVFIATFTCLPEISGGHAFIWEDLDANKMANKVKESLETFQKSPEMGERAKAYAATFNYESHIARYLKIYREMLDIKQ